MGACGTLLVDIQLVSKVQSKRLKNYLRRGRLGHVKYVERQYLSSIQIMELIDVALVGGARATRISLMSV